MGIFKEKPHGKFVVGGGESETKKGSKTESPSMGEPEGEKEEGEQREKNDAISIVVNMNAFYHDDGVREEIGPGSGDHYPGKKGNKNQKGNGAIGVRFEFFKHMAYSTRRNLS